MDLTRKQSVIAGISFFGATIMYILGSSLIDPSLTSNSIAEEITKNETTYALGIVGELLNVFFVSVIGLLLFKAFKNTNKTVAVSYLAGRSIEVIFLLASIVFAVSAFTAATGNAADSSQLAAYADGYLITFTIAMIGLGLGGIVLTVELFKKRIGPQWIAAAGVIGYICLALWAILTAIGLEVTMALFAPGAIFEIAFPIWLIWKGAKISKS